MDNTPKPNPPHPEIVVSSKRCTVVNCKNAQKRGVLLHKYPENKAVREVWKRVVNNPILANKTDHQLRYYGVCTEHFITSDYRTPERIRLNQRAIPRINLGDNQVSVNTSNISYEAMCKTFTDNTQIDLSPDQVIKDITIKNTTLENLTQNVMTENVRAENLTIDVQKENLTTELVLKNKENVTEVVNIEYIGPENFIEEIQFEDIRNTSIQDSSLTEVQNDIDSIVNKEITKTVQDRKEKKKNTNCLLKNSKLFSTTFEKDLAVSPYINLNSKPKPTEVTLNDPLYSDSNPQIIREELEVTKPLSEIDSSEDSATLMVQSVSELQTCRICFTSGHNLVDIFQIDTDDINFYMKYRICFVDLEMEDTINHKHICEKCSLTIRQIYNFKLLCQKGNQRIYALFKSNQLREYCENNNEFEEPDESTSKNKRVCANGVEIEKMPIVEVFENDFGLPPGEDCKFSEIDDNEGRDDEWDLGRNETVQSGSNELSMNEFLPDETEINQDDNELSQELSNVESNLEVPSVNDLNLIVQKNKNAEILQRNTTIFANKENVQYKEVFARNISTNVKLNIIDNMPGENMKNKITIKLSENFKISSNYTKCYFCRIDFSTIVELKEHMKSHLSKDSKTVIKLYRCTKCEAKFLNMQSLIKHIDSIHPRGAKPLTKSSFLCETCGKKFSYRCSYRSHVLIHNTQKLHKCSICEKSFKFINNLNIHMQLHSNIRPFICEYCGKSFKYKKSLEKHFNSHNEIKKPITHPCSLCSEEFTTELRLKNHLQTHYNPKRYKCPFESCSMQFNSKSGLRRHKRRKHVCVKNFVCNECGGTFFENNQLVKHKILHDKNAMKYPCDICGRVFFYQKQLREHKNNHKLRPYLCVHCKICFRDVKYLKFHVAKSHSNLNNVGTVVGEAYKNE